MRHYFPAITGLLGLFATIPTRAEEPGHEAPSITFSEISRKVINLGDHKATYVRVCQPVLPPPPLPLPVRIPTAEEVAAAERLEKKDYVPLNITATVYLNGNKTITEIRWRNGESGNLEYRAYSNADFRYLTQLNHLETETTIYAWFPFVDVCDLTHLPVDEMPSLPLDLNFSDTQSEYYVDARAKDAEAEESTLTGLDYLIAYYQIHAATLKADYDKRVADSEAREKELRENPPVKPDTVIRYWRIK